MEEESQRHSESPEQYSSQPEQHASQPEQYSSHSEHHSHHSGHHLHHSEHHSHRSEHHSHRSEEPLSQSEEPSEHHSHHSHHLEHRSHRSGRSSPRSEDAAPLPDGFSFRFDDPAPQSEQTPPVSENSEVKAPPSRRELWKNEQRKHRIARREHYRNAPFLVRAWKFCLRYVLLALAALALAGFAFYRAGVADKLRDAYIEARKDAPVSKETIYTMSPLDEEGGARIDALEPYGRDDTWTVCVYMVASNLEDHGENDLSELTKMQAEPVKEQNAEAKKSSRAKLLSTFVSELEEKGLSLPEYLYEPTEPEASSTVVTEDVIVSNSVGAASDDIKEITSGVWGDNITVVLQTGGATHWTNSMVNPNKTQRFVYKGGVFSKVSELALQDSCAPETLSDFMRFCEEEYPSDHRMLILWDHGGGVKGYGRDSIFGSAFTLEELKQAFQAVYNPDADKPPYEILGFDACLMATGEVASCLDGYAEYLVASEDIEPEYGWDYGAWLKELSAKPTMNAAQVGRAIVDSYMDYYMAFNKNVGKVYGSNEVALSLVDMHKAAEAYRAYCELCGAQLKDAADDLSVLANIGRTAGNVTRFGSCFYDEINSVDLGGYMDLLAGAYPEEAQKVRTALKDAVAYHRESEGLADSQGLAVYVPVETKDLDALLDCISFIYDTCEDTNVRALYYYKIAGCLNNRMSGYAQLLAGQEPKVLDVSPFEEFEYVAPVIGEVGWTVPVEDGLLDMIQASCLELAAYDPKQDSIIYYGRDEYVQPDGESSLFNSFEGEWASLDGVPLFTEVVSSSASSVSYRSKVKCGGEYYYLLFSYNRDSEEFRISGLKKIETGDDTILMLNSRQTETALAGKILMPVYEAYSFSSGEDSEINGKRIRVTPNSKIELKPLPEGKYLSTVVITDPRGDNYYSGVVEQTVLGGRIIAQRVNTDFYGAD